ncbi:MAG: hypothetical protein E7K04_03235 [Helicobacter sp.]|nr:hypothetical protein [Helicobacter sp.]
MKNALKILALTTVALFAVACAKKDMMHDMKDKTAAAMHDGANMMHDAATEATESVEEATEAAN